LQGNGQKYKTKRVYYLCSKNIQIYLMEIPANPKGLSIESYDYPLPDDRIAQFPLNARDSSKLLICKNGSISEDVFSNIPHVLPSGGLVIFNETRVIHARLLFHKETGSAIEIFCLEPLAPFRDHQQAFQQKGKTEWLCLVGNSKRWKEGKIELSADYNGIQVKIFAERKIKMEGGTSQVLFSWTPAGLTFAEVLELAGKIPLPPYISRKPIRKDEETYQTIYARQDGSVAAPTAGLHFSGAVLASMKERNIDTLKFILHVGAGTFRPVISEDLQGHEMHAEQVYLPVESLEKLRRSLDKPIIAVGTTTTRLLESLYWHGVKVLHGLSEGTRMDVGQWDPYDQLRGSEISREEALDAVIRECVKNGTPVLNGKTSLMIAPGYKFRYPDILITNFHQPKSTLLLLIAAFIGGDWRKAYQFALDHDFRFLSYGDSCLFFQQE
jgi:S-adenosylmethionine:tRNA ribosyltransferase-isomerase